MTGLRYSPLHVTELCGEMQGNFKVGCARLISCSITFKFNCFKISTLKNYLHFSKGVSNTSKEQGSSREMKHSKSTGMISF